MRSYSSRPLLVGRDRAERQVGRLDRQVERAAVADVDDAPAAAAPCRRAGARPPRSASASPTARCAAGGRPASASSRSSDSARCAPRLSCATAWISSTMTVSAPARKRRLRLGGEQDVERLGRRDEDVRRPARHRLALVRRRVAGAHHDADLGQRAAVASRQRAAAPPAAAAGSSGRRCRAPSAARRRRRGCGPRACRPRAAPSRRSSDQRNAASVLPEPGRRRDQRVGAGARSPASPLPAPASASRTGQRTSAPTSGENGTASPPLRIPVAPSNLARRRVVGNAVLSSPARARLYRERVPQDRSIAAVPGPWRDADERPRARDGGGPPAAGTARIAPTGSGPGGSAPRARQVDRLGRPRRSSSSTTRPSRSSSRSPGTWPSTSSATSPSRTICCTAASSTRGRR